MSLNNLTHFYCSEIYCSGSILHQIQTAKLFDDDKYFVDMKLKSAPGEHKVIKHFTSVTRRHPPAVLTFSLSAEVVLSAFQNLSNAFPNGTVPPMKLQEFLDANFEKPGTEFESWTPPDWKDK